MIPLMLCRSEAELRHQRMLRLQRDAELMELASQGGNEFVANQKPTGVVGDRSVSTRTWRYVGESF